ncbi:hypothetical protein ECANGB1_382 [Enterospora canceri]|uniref:Uncharacterized protein n=1 Tax=Enterospora canceri TaxID=1081671 RepID=A0A1Y1S812_9MICR|nr:hypothetical protein ECANGB1_382 [Enterospora canceri]
MHEEYRKRARSVLCTSPESESLLDTADRAEYRMPGAVVDQPAVKLFHSVIGRNGIIYYFKIESVVEDGGKEVSWFVSREFNSNSTLVQIEKDLIDLKQSPRLLNNFINTFVVKMDDIPVRSEYLIHNNEIKRMRVFGRKLLEIEDGKIVRILNVNGVSRYAGDRMLINNEHELVCSCRKERDAWITEISR